MAIGKVIQAAVVEGAKAASKAGAKKAAGATAKKAAGATAKKAATPKTPKATGDTAKKAIVFKTPKATGDTAKKAIVFKTPKATETSKKAAAPAQPVMMDRPVNSLVFRDITEDAAKKAAASKTSKKAAAPATALPTGMRAVRDAAPTKAAVPGKGISLGKIVGGALGGGALGGALLANEIGGDARKPPIKPAPKPAASKPAGIEIEVKSKQARAPKNPMSAPSKAPNPGKPPANPMSAPVKTIKTKGGDYPVYAKASSEGGSFRSAFAAARKAGKKTFEWQGRKYTTEVKK